MIYLKPTGLKILKSFHLILIMMWTVGVVAMSLILHLLPQNGNDTILIVNCNLLLDNWLTIPGALLTVLTGIVYGIFTKWGFFKFRWLAVKWILAVAVICFGTFYFHPRCLYVLDVAERLGDGWVNEPSAVKAAAEANIASVMQGVALIICVVLSVFKPWGKMKKQ